jgi:CheY-like chemotaxis protein
MSNPASSVVVKPRILVVEDETIIAMDIAMQLRELGYEAVGHATTGEQAIDLARQLRPDLVLMDVQLGGAIDGITAAQAIHTQFGTPCIFLSAFTNDQNRRRALAAEPLGYLAKPFEEYELREVLVAAFKHGEIQISP